jgi:hypothetical protein
VTRVGVLHRTGVRPKAGPVTTPRLDEPLSIRGQLSLRVHLKEGTLPHAYAVPHIRTLFGSGTAIIIVRTPGRSKR